MSLALPSTYHSSESSDVLVEVGRPSPFRPKGKGGEGSKVQRELTAKVTDCRLEREQALSLVHRVYRESGLISAETAGMRVLPQHLADETEIMVVKEGNRVFFTATLVRDGDLGLPLESLFSSEIEAMRCQGLNLAEVSCLAHDSLVCEASDRFDTFVLGLSILAQTARRREVDRLVLAVHPRHAKVYERLFGCFRCSEVKEYAAVRGNPAILCVHDFSRCDEVGYPLYQQIYGNRFSLRQMEGVPMSEEEKRDFAAYLVDGEFADCFIPMAA